MVLSAHGNVAINSQEIQKTRYFKNILFIQKDYWCGSSVAAQDVTLTGAERTARNAEFIEEEPIGLRSGVQIKGLTKEFHKDKVAVNNIHLNMYEGQITALLGHNGAGKSTTMSMLTGLFPPTSGTALVNGFDIRKDIQGTRKQKPFHFLPNSKHVFFYEKVSVAVWVFAPNMTFSLTS